MKTTVTNILNRNEKSLFVNDFDPKHNLISHIICQRNQTSLLLDQDHRKKLELELEIKEGISKNGDKLAFCYKLDLIARQISN
jgi:hypothetical protein